MRANKSRLAALLLGSALLLTVSFGCGGPPSTAGGGPSSEDQPELTDADINERINDTRVWDVPPESGTGQPISWSFDGDEPKEIVVVDRQLAGTRATLVLDIKTRSAPRSNTQRFLAGQIRTEWQLRTGWALRRWEIVETENISMKYKDIAKPTPQPSTTQQ